MYLLEEPLLGRIKRIAELAEQKTGGALRFEEYIALPTHGAVTLRFMLDDNDITLEKLDGYEAQLYDIIGDEFIADFMGSVYAKAGVDFSELEARLAGLAYALAEEPVIPTPHAPGIARDAVELLKRAGLSPDRAVWEIQVEDGELLMLLLSDDNKAPVCFGGEPRLFVGEAYKKPCEGLIRAAFYAKRNRISLARLLMGERPEL